MDASDPLARCPFCAARAARSEEIAAACWAVVCHACGGIGPVSPDRDESLFLWDARAVLPKNLGLLRTRNAGV